jgi:uncharacterized Ntn-hydrolase superfamily protein
MTWSIVAREKSSGLLGIAVATRFFSAGALVPYAAAGIGAIATQALVNPFYGIDGLKLLRRGFSPQDVVSAVTARDAGGSHRQVHMVDASGRIGAFSGADCVPWYGHITGDQFSVAGNMVAGQNVVSDTAEAFCAAEEVPFPQRLILAMKAGEAAGGDRRGRQSAALLMVGRDEWPALDLRVDDHADPLSELIRLEKVSHEEWIPFRSIIPTRQSPSGVTDPAEVEAITRSRVSNQQV